MRKYLDICDDCLNRNDDWCDEYDEPCEECHENCRRNDTILSGNDIESQDDFNAFNMMMGFM